MYPDQNSPGNMPAPPQNNFDFIVNPGQKPRKSLLPSFGKGGGFLPKIILIVGGAVGLMVVLWVVTLIFGGGSLNVASITSLVQSQQEIVRVADSAKNSIFGQELRNSSATTLGTVATQQVAWIAVLAEEGTELKSDQLALKQSAETDQQLEAAVTNGTFDEVYAEMLQNMLVNYSNELESAFNQSSDGDEKALLAQHYQQVAMLLEKLTGETAE